MFLFTKKIVLLMNHLVNHQDYILLITLKNIISPWANSVLLGSDGAKQLRLLSKFHCNIPNHVYFSYLLTLFLFKYTVPIHVTVPIQIHCSILIHFNNFFKVQYTYLDT